MKELQSLKRKKSLQLCFLVLGFVFGVYKDEESCKFPLGYLGKVDLLGLLEEEPMTDAFGFPRNNFKFE